MNRRTEEVIDLEEEEFDEIWAAVSTQAMSQPIAANVDVLGPCRVELQWPYGEERVDIDTRKAKKIEFRGKTVLSLGEFVL